MEGGVRQGPVTWPVTLSALLDPTIYLPSSGLPLRTERHGPVAQPVFKTGAVVQPTARSVRLRRRSAKPHSARPRALSTDRLAEVRLLDLPLKIAQDRLRRGSTIA